MNHLTLYRKWRPKTFDEVKGREEIVTILKNQIKLNKIAHAYLFCGTRGTGKTSVAKIFAKAVNCENTEDGSPCYKCKTCVALNENNLDIVEIDAASNNGVDNIRELRTDAEYLPTIGKYKVYIIDEVHMLSQGAFNALLKILEEPPEYVIFILATTEINKIPVTIVSRCQRFDFMPIDTKVIINHLVEISNVEKVKISYEAIKYIANIADGGFRDALSIFEQIISYVNGDDELLLNDVMRVLGRDGYKFYHEILKNIKDKDMIKLNANIDNIISNGKTYEIFVSEFANYVKNIAMMKISNNVFDNLTDEEFNYVINDCDMFSHEYLTYMLDKIILLNENLKKIENKRIYIDLTMIKLVMPRDKNNENDMILRLENLEDRIENLKFNNISITSEPDIEDDGDKEFLTATKHNIEKLNTDLQEVIRQWNNINWNQNEVEGRLLQWIKRTAVSVKNDNIAIITDSELTYNRLIKYIDNIREIILKELNVDVKIEIHKTLSNVKKWDLTKIINFSIEKE